MAVSVIIPALNEEEWIAGAVESAFAAGAAEVIVVDGGSVDRTSRFATAARARVLLADPMRARQLNRAGAAAAVEKALTSGTIFGGFRIQFAEPDRKLRLAENMINYRSTLLRAPWGDQAQFIARERFLSAGGYRELPIMEDYELARRMKKAGRTRILPLQVTTSGRRFLRKGILRTAMTNWLIISRYHQGVDLEELARMYRG